MPFGHGVTTSESKTSVLAPAQIAAGIPFVVGTAPVNLSKETTLPVNKPFLAYTYDEAVNALGYSDNWVDYTLCEFIDSHFAQFQLSPVIFVNVLDPATHVTPVAAAAVTLTDKVANIAVEGVIRSTVVVQSEDLVTTYVVGTDYTLGYDADGFTVITVKTGGTIPTGATQLSVAYSKLDPTAVTATDIIGGVDGVTGLPTGLELVQQVFPRFGLLPGLILAPGYSDDATVASVMVAKASNINGHFKALALTDLPTDTITAYADAPAWKTTNGCTSELQVPTWPMVKLDAKHYHLSTQLAGAIGATDLAYDGVPYASPSNKPLKANGAILADGTEVFMDPDQANYLNSQGIMTALNFVGGWKTWGNNTGAYPANTDVKDAFIAVKRMFVWLANTITLTYWQKVDDPANKRMVETVTDSLNIWINGLSGSGALLGGRVEFLASENPVTDLLAGKMKFHVYQASPVPGQELDFVIEYDAQYLQSIFG